MIYWIGYVFFRILSRIYFPRRVLGLENIPANGTYIIASNHVSNLDPFIVGISLTRRLSFIAKESLFRNKILGFFLYKVGAFPIKRDTSDFRALREALRRLNNYPIVIFPEGTRKATEGKRKSQPGIGFLAIKAGVPVIPVFVDGSQNVLPPGKIILKRHCVTVTFGQPVSFSKEQPFLEIANQIMGKIFSLSPQKT
jgi:1-acyl-sn-glycerol-3-phosphate acyltransferase